jgi:hypothetical protein
MYASKAAAERIKMCDDCRVVAQFEVGDDPLAGAPRRLTRTTDDDLREREATAGDPASATRRGEPGEGSAR